MTLKIALSGSIGMGKSTIAKMFSQLGILIWSADEAVHKLYSKGEIANKLLGEQFGDIYDENGDIDRQILSKLILENPQNLNIIEKIVHPLVKSNREFFISNAQLNNLPYIILDIPLLFETNSQNNFDKIIIVDCNAETQEKRVLARPNMTPKKFKAILSKQIPNLEKIKMADFVIDTNQELDNCFNQVKIINDKILELAKDA
jgi:dephospho-CoA kinase